MRKRDNSRVPSDAGDDGGHTKELKTIFLVQNERRGEKTRGAGEKGAFFAAVRGSYCFARQELAPYMQGDVDVGPIKDQVRFCRAGAHKIQTRQKKSGPRLISEGSSGSPSNDEARRSRTVVRTHIARHVRMQMARASGRTASHSSL